MTKTLNLPENVKTIMNMLNRNGYEAFVVGGCVRDAILSRTPHDWDITTSAKPDEIKEVFSEPDFKVLPIGENFGMIAVLYDGEQYEITTYRKDGKYNDNRHPDSVDFAENIETDLSRRDFTMNAIAYNDKVGFIDPFGGYDDIKNGTIRCVGNPKDRFEEDRLRVLRAIRFEAQLAPFNMMLDEEIMQFINHNPLSELWGISYERINAELCKILMSEGMGARSIRKHKRFFFKNNILRFEKADGFAQNNVHHFYDVFEHTLHAMESIDKKAFRNFYRSFVDFHNILNDDITLRLALLFHDIGKPETYVKDEQGVGHFPEHAKASVKIAEEELLRLRFSRKTIDDVCQLIRYHEIGFPQTVKSWKRVLNKMDQKQVKRWFVLKHLDSFGKNTAYIPSSYALKTSLSVFHEVLEEKPCFTLKDLAINGKDMITLGFKENKYLGYALKTLLNMIIEEKVENTKDELEFAATNILAKENIDKWYTELVYDAQFCGRENVFDVLPDLNNTTIKEAFEKNNLPYDDNCHYIAKKFNHEGLTIKEFLAKYPHLQINEWFYDDKNRDPKALSETPTVVFLGRKFDYVMVSDNGAVDAKLVIFIKEKE